MSDQTLRKITRRLYLAHQRKLAIGEEADEEEYREAFDAWLEFGRQEYDAINRGEDAA